MDRLNIGRISSKKMDMLQDLSVDFSQLVKKYVKNLRKLSSKDQKAFGKLFGDFKDGLDDLSTNESVNEAKYNTKQDAMNAYMKGKVSAKELDKIAKNDFNSSVATKKELQNFLDSGYMKTLMANTYGLKVPAMEKKVKELMVFAEGTLKEDIQSLNEAEEPKIISDLRDVMKSGYKSVKDPVSGKKMKVDSYSASAVIAVYDALRKPDVKAKFASQPLPKMVNVAFKVAKK